MVKVEVIDVEEGIGIRKASTVSGVEGVFNSKVSLFEVFHSLFLNKVVVMLEKSSFE